MTVWTAGMRMTADRLNDVTSLIVTSGVTAATNFSVISYQANFSGGNVSIALVVQYSGSTITTTSTDQIADTLCATLPTGHRPQAKYWTGVARNSVDLGGCNIDTDGTVTLTTMIGSLASGQNCNINATYANA